jgi:hypothetical protein
MEKEKTHKTTWNKGKFHYIHYITERKKIDDALPTIIERRTYVRMYNDVKFF